MFFIHIRRVVSSFLLGILIAGATFTYADEQSSTITVTIDNAPPQISSIALSSVAYGNAEYASGIILSASTTTVYITGIALDPNSENSIATTTATFYRTDLAATSSCSIFLKNCYRTDCTIDTSYGSAAEARYACPIELASWADATDTGSAYATSTWTAYLHTSDTSGLTTIATTTVEVNSLLAFSLPGTLSYGTLTTGATTTATSASEIIIEQGGNTAATIAIRGTDLGCSVTGSIPVANQHWSLGRTTWDSTSAFPLAITATSTDLYLARRTSTSTIATSSVFFTIKIPTSGVSGTCTGTLYVDALASTDVGMLIDSGVRGVRYTSTNNITGTTKTNGLFKRLPGDTVTFTIGTAVLGSVARDGVYVNEFIFPQDLVGVARSNVTDVRVTRIARFLQSLDEDLDASNGIQISEYAHTVITQKNLNIQNAPDAKLRSALRDVYPSRDLVNTQKAQAHLLNTTQLFDPEAFLK